MSKKVELKERVTGEVLYPVTLSENVITNDNKNLQDVLDTLNTIPTGGTEGQVLTYRNGSAQWESSSNFESFKEIYAYGVEWDITVADPHITRIGNMSLHKTLPIQSQLKGCIAQNNKVIYWLNEDDWRYPKDQAFEDEGIINLEGLSPKVGEIYALLLYNPLEHEEEWYINRYLLLKSQDNRYLMQITKVIYPDDNCGFEAQLIECTPNSTIEDGERFEHCFGPRLDGYDGTVRVYCPSFYIKSESIDNKRRVWLSTIKIDNTWTYQPELLIDAYKSTILDTVPSNMGYLSTLKTYSAISVVNTGSYCRGGQNRASYDKYLTGDENTQIDIFRTDRGKPRTNLTRSLTRTYSRNAGSEVLSYEQYKNIFYWLWVVEYANFNSQEVYNEELTTEGYRQGGMGPGVTTIADEYFNKYNEYRPIIPCGYCDNFGNNSGIKTGTLPNIQVSSAATENISAYGKPTYFDSESNIQKNVWECTVSGKILILNKVNNNTLDGLQAARIIQSGNTTYNIQGLTSGQSLIFHKGNTIIQTVSADGEVTIDWGDDAQVRGIRASFTGNCNIKLNIVNSEQVAFTLNGTTLSVPRWRGFDNPFGDVWTNLDGILIDTPIATENSTIPPICYIITDPENYTDSLIGVEEKASRIITQLHYLPGYIKEWFLGNSADMIPESVGGGTTTYKCDYYYVNYLNTPKTLLVGGYASNGMNSGLGGFSSSAAVSHSWSYVGFRSVSRFVSFS